MSLCFKKQFLLSGQSTYIIQQKGSEYHDVITCSKKSSPELQLFRQRVNFEGPR